MQPPSQPILVYDGECPFCANYVRLLRLRELFPNLQLLDARENRDHPAVRQLSARGLRVDDGMALLSGDRIYHGAESIHALAEFGRPEGVFGQANNWVFRSQRRSAILYPLLRA
ncbi:DCC1-like thiol-disulfide oxidoreductase family protein, partial [Hypericibacter sp.]|uniref:DCC1-like thiol-disulfide oxidoreductase family protein n=1 Tax=Hypericibacter sp. TaxID=2705401 RepID=UPI003D6CB26B